MESTFAVIMTKNQIYYFCLEHSVDGSCTVVYLLFIV